MSYPDVQLGLRPLWCCHIPAKGQGSVSSTCSPSLSSAELIMGSPRCFLPRQHHKLFRSSHSQSQQASVDMVRCVHLTYLVNIYIFSLSVTFWLPAGLFNVLYVYMYNLQWLMLFVWIPIYPVHHRRYSFIVTVQHIATNVPCPIYQSVS